MHCGSLRPVAGCWHPEFPSELSAENSRWSESLWHEPSHLTQGSPWYLRTCLPLLPRQSRLPRHVSRSLIMWQPSSYQLRHAVSLSSGLCGSEPAPGSRQLLYTNTSRMCLARSNCPRSTW